jgi:hypothetical protein
VTVFSALWRRLDTAGHDACRLEEGPLGWRLSGLAVFRDDDGVAQLSYEASCDRAWHSQEGRVYGWIAGRPVDFRTSRTRDGSWMLNGAIAPGLADCVDLDFSFTPATNVFQTRRLALAQGQSADVPAAWLDPSAGTLTVLSQRYERIADLRYRYEAPTVNYAATLELAESGFVRHYPHLWILED